ncbi:hypothetical protein C5O78_05745 [Treponema phagedenis]|nr:hypothetical protein C5O78_05745 [Treponema phagedenis]
MCKSGAASFNQRKSIFLLCDNLDFGLVSGGDDFKTMVSLLTVAKFQAMFCLTCYCKQAKLVGEPMVEFLRVRPC